MCESNNESAHDPDIDDFDLDGQKDDQEAMEQTTHLVTFLEEGFYDAD